MILNILLLRKMGRSWSGKKVHSIIGGFHLARVDKSVIDRTVDELKKFQFENIIPLHCTGIRATNAIINAFEERTKLLYSGSVETLGF
jgi:7,8-dihydropterin-6-yl-methyl-4-(beta-D-ribofuranosyl)aminobenzene 5'-phosphate synthase